MAAVTLPINGITAAYFAWQNRPHNRVHIGNPGDVPLEEIPRFNHRVNPDHIEEQQIVRAQPQAIQEATNPNINNITDDGHLNIDANHTLNNSRLEENIPPIQYDYHIQNIFHDSTIGHDIHVIKGQHIYIGDHTSPKYNLVKDYPIIPYTRHIFTDNVGHLREFISKYNLHTWKYSDYRKETFIFMNCKSSDIVDLAEKQNYHSFITCTAPIKQKGKRINARGDNEEFILHYKEDGKDGYQKEYLGKNLVNGLAKTRVILNDSIHTRFDKAYTEERYDTHEWGDNYTAVNTADGYTYYLNKDGNVVYATDSNGRVTFDERIIENNNQQIITTSNDVISTNLNDSLLVKDGDYYVDKNGILYETDSEDDNNAYTQQAIENSLANQQMTESPVQNNMFGSFRYIDEDMDEVDNVLNGNMDESIYSTYFNTINQNENNNYIFQSSIYNGDNLYTSKNISEELNSNNKRSLDDSNDDISIKKQIISNTSKTVLRTNINIKSNYKPWTKSERDIISNYLNYGSNKQKESNIIYKELAGLLKNRAIESIRVEIKRHGKIENYNSNIVKSSCRRWTFNEKNIIDNCMASLRYGLLNSYLYNQI